MKKLSGGLIAVIVIVAVVLILAIVCVSMYNGLAQAKVSVDEKYAEIEAQLQRRNDLIPNLVNTVKGYTDHESEVLKNVSDARAKLAGATTPADQAAADSELTSALSRLLVVVENYPDLKANQNFIALQDELAGTENRITTARNAYNEEVASFNKRVVSFPSNIFANIFGYSQADMFKAAAGASEVPNVSFE